MARSITDPGAQTRALAEVASALARAGQHEQAAALASQAETVTPLHHLRSEWSPTCNFGP